jgi:hypothetical protein
LKLEIRNSKYEIRNTEYGIRNTEYGIRNTEQLKDSNDLKVYNDDKDDKNFKFEIRNTDYEERNTEKNQLKDNGLEMQKANLHNFRFGVLCLEFNALFLLLDSHFFYRVDFLFASGDGIVCLVH